MHFRAGNTDDVEQLWALRGRCVRQRCSSHYPPEVIAPWAASPPPLQYARLLAQGGCVVAEEDGGGMLGFAVLDYQNNEVDALFVDPARSGQGVGQALMQQLLALADPARDVVLSASLNAVAFYLRQGFIAEGEQAYPHPCGVALASVRMRRRCVPRA